MRASTSALVIGPPALHGGGVRVGGIGAAVGARVHLDDVGLHVGGFHHHVLRVNQDHVPILEHAGVGYFEAGVAGANDARFVGGGRNLLKLGNPKLFTIFVQFEIEEPP